MSKGTCAECSLYREIKHDDPRVPPLDQDICLCGECFAMAASERVSELHEEIQALVDALGS